MKKITIVTIIAATCLLAFLFLPMFTVFSFTETKTDNPSHVYIMVKKDKNFQIRFTHSIHLSDVIENYTITESKKIKLVSMEYEDVAVGMPANAEEGQEIQYKDGKYKLSYDNKAVDNFTLYIGNIDLDLVFLYNGASYNLKTTLKKGKSYLFEVKKISIYQLMKGDVMKYE